MSASTSCIDNYVAAAFAYEFLDGGVDVEALGRIRQGDVDDWVAAVAGSGLFTNAQVARVEAGWQQQPRTLLDALLSEADEVTARRCEALWAALAESDTTGETRELVAVSGYSSVVAPASITIA